MVGDGPGAARAKRTKMVERVRKFISIKTNRVRLVFGNQEIVRLRVRNQMSAWSLFIILYNVMDRGTYAKHSCCNHISAASM